VSPEQRPDADCVGGQSAEGVSAFDSHRKALSELAKNQHRALLRYLTARTRSAQEAEELAQATYAKLLALDKPQAVGFLVGYMWKIAGNLVLERQRAYAIRVRLDPKATFEATQSAPSPESLLYTEQQLKLIGEALRSLPSKCAEAFMLRYVEELKLEDICKRMALSERTVRTYLARAAERIHTYIEATEAAGGAQDER